MLLVADAALAGVTLPEEARPRTGVFIGLDLDLNTTNYHFRWWVLKHADEWAERLGLHPSSPEFAAWKRSLLDVAHPALNANRVMGALGSIAASRIARAFHLGGPSFTISDGESSDLHALAAAAGALRRGELDAALVGAVDLAGDVRTAGRSDGEAVGEGAAAVVLKRLDDAVRDGDSIYAVIRDDDPAAVELLPDAARDVGCAGAAAGMAALVKAILCLHRQILPPTDGRPARYWLRDRIDGPRRAAVRCPDGDGGCVQVVLEEWEPAASEDRPDRRQPLGPRDEALFVVEGGDAAAITRGLARLGACLSGADRGIEADARAWFHDHPGSSNDPFVVAFVAHDRAELRAQIDRRGAASRTGRPHRRHSATASSSRRGRWAGRAKSPSSIPDRAMIFPAWAATWPCNGPKCRGDRTPRTSACAVSSYRRSSGMMRRRCPPTRAKRSSPRWRSAA